MRLNKGELKMCDFCSNDNFLMKKKVLNDSMVGWDKDMKATELWYMEIAVMLDDRGYIRLVNPDDCQCLDHGQKIEINYCPMCGKKYREKQ